MFYGNNRWWNNPSNDLEWALCEMLDYMEPDVYDRTGTYGELDAIADWNLIMDWHPEINATMHDVMDLMEVWFYSPRGGAVILDEAHESVVARIAGGHDLTLDEAISLVGELDPTSDEDNVEINGNRYYYDELRMEVGY